MSRYKGGFTLPGEAGYEQLTLKMAEKWGADVIRDSDGTVLSDDIVNAGYGIYSTICIIRDHNEWVKAHPGMLQQTFLSAGPVTAVSSDLSVPLMEQFYAPQFQVNDGADAMRYWQVRDRTAGTVIPREPEKETGESLHEEGGSGSPAWRYDREKQAVVIRNAEPFHRYTVSFLAWQIWEQISMYNHVTNDWGEKEHLMPVDPVYPEARAYLLDWLDRWCREHPSTTVVRFTSLFYNFTWMWGSDERNRYLFTDWGSYDFSVSPLMLDRFEAAYGYALTAEDFINQGKFQVTHMPASPHKRDWMRFVSGFVADLGREMVELVHGYGKKAYVFYDDSWIGLEPYGPDFKRIGFDGMIKCVFSGYEVRLCSGVDVPTHEIRLHPYLFPVGLGGAPTFMEGGDPTRDAKEYWMRVRRGLLRVPIERIGLGGYLHLTEDFPDFQDYIELISDEFRELEALHKEGKPEGTGIRVAVLHDWGSLRPWTLSGHFHETYMHDLIHVIESLAGLPVDTSFINFEDVRSGALDGLDVVINCGRAGDAWSGGDVWKEPELGAAVAKWVYEGGTLIGINQPSAAQGADRFYRLADLLGVDEDTGARVCHGRWSFVTEDPDGLVPEGCALPVRDGRFLTDGKARVLLSHDGYPDLTRYEFGSGTGFYLSGYSYSPENTRLLLNIICSCRSGKAEELMYVSENPNVDCAFFPKSGKLVAVNLTLQPQKTRVCTEAGCVEVTVPESGQVIMDIRNAE
ncbi:MAG: 1,3-beta-galactosyl-N-acetylhexosamine phosphorylase [Lachnospiraceae bacterium]|nr:1,3-beta-galactosyl-N-acetylhexosamine phosphorylase [Lachnospiraceae bacterium]